MYIYNLWLGLGLHHVEEKADLVANSQIESNAES
jgi:hypothetical protein